MGSVLSYFGSLTLVQGGLVNLNSGGGVVVGGGALIQEGVRKFTYPCYLMKK